MQHYATFKSILISYQKKELIISDSDLKCLRGEKLPTLVRVDGFRTKALDCHYGFTFKEAI